MFQKKISMIYCMEGCCLNFFLTVYFIYCFLVVDLNLATDGSQLQNTQIFLIKLQELDGKLLLVQISKHFAYMSYVYCKAPLVTMACADPQVKCAVAENKAIRLSSLTKIFILSM